VADLQDVVIMTAETEALAAWRKLLEEDYLGRLTYWSDIREQLPLLYAAAALYDAPVIAELGTRTGHSTSALLAGAADAGTSPGSALAGRC
jgi:predicted O-methyltransferase YrrM